MENSILKLSPDIPKLSLRDLSLIKVASALFNNQELLSSILECHFQQRLIYRLHAREGEHWATVQATAKKLLSNISICDTLKESINELLWPATYRILLWKSTFAPCLDNKYLQHIYWTDQGRIDRTRTARYIVGNKNISIRRRFILACSMCLSEEIPDIWEEMSKEDKLYFYTESQEDICPLLIFWAHALGSSENISEQYVEDAFETSTSLGLFEAVKYLFSLLTTDSKSDRVLFCLDVLKEGVSAVSFLEESEIETGFFLLSQMSNESQLAVFNTHYILAMALLLHSSNREYFLQVLVGRLEPICAHDFEDLLRMIFYTYHFEVSKDYGYRELFINVWRTIPDPVRIYTATELNLGVRCLCMLIKDSFPFLLREGALEKLTELTSADFKPRTSIKQSDFNPDKWEFLLFLIKEVVTMPSLWKNRDLCFKLLRMRQSNEDCWFTILKFISKIGCKK